MNPITTLQKRRYEFITNLYHGKEFAGKLEAIDLFIQAVPNIPVYNSSIDKYETDAILFSELYKLSSSNPLVPALIITPDINTCLVCGTNLLIATPSAPCHPTVYHASGLTISGLYFKKKCLNCCSKYNYSHYYDAKLEVSYAYASALEQKYLQYTSSTFVELALLRDVTHLMYVYIAHAHKRRRKKEALHLLLRQYAEHGLDAFHKKKAPQPR